MCLSSVLQSPEECAAIKEKVKKFIADRNARECATRSGLGDVGAPSTAATEMTWLLSAKMLVKMG